MTNLEGRVLLRRAAVAAPPTGCRTDLEVIAGAGRTARPRQDFSAPMPREVFDELRRASAGGVADYAGITYERIAAEHGVFWPCPTPEHPGTPRLFLDRFADPRRPGPLPSGRAPAAGRGARRRVPAAA